MSTPTPPEGMSVGELREWLKNFGKKQKEHFHKNQIKRRSPSKVSSIANRFSSSNTVRDCRSLFEQNGPNDGIEEENSQQENNRPGMVKRQALPKQPVVQNNSNSENQCPLDVNNHVASIMDEGSFNLEKEPSFELDNAQASPMLSEVYEKSIDSAADDCPSDEGLVEEEASGELPEEPSLQDDLCLTLSGVSMIASQGSFSVDAEASKPLPAQEPLKVFVDTEDEDSNPSQDSEKLMLEPVEGKGDFAKIADAGVKDIHNPGSRIQQPKLSAQGQGAALLLREKLMGHMDFAKIANDGVKDYHYPIQQPKLSTQGRGVILSRESSSNFEPKPLQQPKLRTQDQDAILQQATLQLQRLSRESSTIFKTKPVSRGKFPTQQRQRKAVPVAACLQPKAVPAAWSDLEPFDFSCSDDSSGNDSSSIDEKEKDDLDRSWQVGDDGGDVRRYLQRQALPAFQGYWSDNECGEDDNSVATSWSDPFCVVKPKKGRNPRYRNSRFGLETTTILEEEPLSGLTLFGAATASMGHKPLSNPRSLSYFMDKTARSSKAKKGSLQQQGATMHNANLLQIKTLTAGTLDALCNTIGGKPVEEEDRRGSLGSFFERVDQGTICSWSEDSGEPSIAPNAVDANLSKVLSHDTDITTPTSVDSYEQRQPSNTRRLHSFSDIRQEAPSPEHGKAKVAVVDILPKKKTAPTEHGKAKVAVVDIQKEKFVSPEDGKVKVAVVDIPKEKTAKPTSGFSSVLQKFGGGGRRSRKTRIERQKEALEQQWQATRKVQYVKKAKWQVGRNGMYKKRVVLDAQAEF